MTRLLLLPLVAPLLPAGTGMACGVGAVSDSACVPTDHAAHLDVDCFGRYPASLKAIHGKQRSNQKCKLPLAGC